MGWPSDEFTRSLGWTRFHRLFLNPRATANLYGWFFAGAAVKVANRDTGGVVEFVETIHDGHAKLCLKNFGGRLRPDMVIPAFSKVAEEYWRVEDMAVALEERLRQPETFALVGADSAR